MHLTRPYGSDYICAVCPNPSTGPAGALPVMTGQTLRGAQAGMERHMHKSSLLAAILGVAASSGMPSMPRLITASTYRFGRSRVPGKPGRAGDKLARLAAEGRLGLGSPK